MRCCHVRGRVRSNDSDCCLGIESALGCTGGWLGPSDETSLREGLLGNRPGVFIPFPLSLYISSVRQQLQKTLTLLRAKGWGFVVVVVVMDL